MNPLQWAAFALAAAGVAYPLFKNGQAPTLALIIALSFVFYSVIKKKVVSDGKTAMFFETLTMVLPAVGLIAWMEAKGLGAAGVLSGWQWLLLPMTGVVTSVPLLLYAKGIRKTSYTLSGILMYINPILQLLLGLLYGETMTQERLVTFVLTWAALLLFLFATHKKKA